MDKLKPCPFCDSKLEYRKNEYTEGFCCCNIECGAVITFAGMTDGGTIDPFKAINRRPSPHKYTMEELRKINHDPVYLKDLSKKELFLPEGWAEIIWSIKDSDMISILWTGIETEDYISIEDYNKTWVAYDREPEEFINKL